MATRNPVYFDTDGISHQLDDSVDGIVSLNYSVNAPGSNGIVQTAGDLPLDDVMGDSLENTMASATDGIQFAAVTDVAAELDHLVLPIGNFAPSATPTLGEGSAMIDTLNDKFWFYSSGAWVDASIATEAESIQNSYTADEALLIRDALYVSAADNVSKADASADATAKAIGFAVAAAADTFPVEVQSAGVMTGFSGLTPGGLVYLSTTAGLVSSTKPSGAGNNITAMGIAKSATEIQINIQYLGKL
jgi:hypothetical protein